MSSRFCVLTFPKSRARARLQLPIKTPQEHIKWSKARHYLTTFALLYLIQDLELIPCLWETASVNLSQRAFIER
jgi:hypothetical protein